MSFYFSLYQIIDSVERLMKDVQHLASRSLRISPRDARANRELLETCESKLAEVQGLLTQKSHISKITLRKAALLFQILEVNYRRVFHLASAAGSAGLTEKEIRGIWQMLSVAQRHYRTILENLGGLTGIPASLVLKAEAEGVPTPFGLTSVARREFAYQAEALKLLDKAVEVLGEEEGLSEKLILMRKELLDLKRTMKQYSTEVSAKEDPLSVPSLS